MYPPSLTNCLHVDGPSSRMVWSHYAATVRAAALTEIAQRTSVMASERNDR